jgi:prepilin peptidase CpaA
MKDIAVPNWLNFGVVLAFILGAFIVPLPEGAVRAHALFAAAVLAAAFVFHVQGAVGAGAGKFAATAALWLGPTMAYAEYLAGVAILGSLYVIVMRALRRDISCVPYAPILIPLFVVALAQDPMWRQAVAHFGQS